MVSLWYLVRLLRCTFFQKPQRFQAPTAGDASDASNKVAVVTGGNAGIGLETVRHLAGIGMTVIIGCRDTGKGEKAAQLLKQEETGRKLRIHVAALDLSDLSSVTKFAHRVESLLDGRPLDLLVNNAGVMHVPYTRSEQGHELQFAVNYLGHFHLTQLLLPRLKSPGGRVVVVNAELHTLADDATPDYTYQGKGDQGYWRSKLAGVWFAYELQRRRPDLIVPVLHPGVIDTGLADAPRWLKRLLFINSREGAQTTLYCCLAPDVKGLTYYNNALGVVPSSKLSYDRQRAAALWNLSEQLTCEFK
uniref:Lipid body protein n=1 Tax=Lobosphaera incisa TaxID=312850 RepID=A0A1X9QDT8_9CHLO|nr:lipid body protein [Lobosphaera incisa]